MGDVEKSGPAEPALLPARDLPELGWRQVAVGLLVLVVVAAVYEVGLSLVLGKPEEPGTFGDSFGAFNAIVTGASLLLVAYSLGLQRQESRDARREHREAIKLQREEANAAREEHREALEAQRETLAQQTGELELQREELALQRAQASHSHRYRHQPYLQVQYSGVFSGGRNDQPTMLVELQNLSEFPIIDARLTVALYDIANELATPSIARGRYIHVLPGAAGQTSREYRVGDEFGMPPHVLIVYRVSFRNLAGGTFETIRLIQRGPMADGTGSSDSTWFDTWDVASFVFMGDDIVHRHVSPKELRPIVMEAFSRITPGGLPAGLEWEIPHGVRRG